MKKETLFQIRYNAKRWLYLPITFVKRELLGRDILYKRFFRDKWGFLPADLTKLTRKGNTAWIVANSGGEVTQALSFFKKLKEQFPGHKLILSTESYDTYGYAQKLGLMDFVFFSPWDIKGACRRALGKIKPNVIIFIEHCLYPVLAKEAKINGCKTVLCSGMIRSHMLKDNFLLERSFNLKFFDDITKLALKHQDDLDSALELGIEKQKTRVLGNMKFDLTHLLLSEKQKLKIREDLGLMRNEPVFIIGSLHHGEIDLVLEAFQDIRMHFGNLKLIVAPRWNSEIQLLQERIRHFGYIYELKSMLNRDEPIRYDVLIVDTFGELPYLYGIASVAFIASSVVPINARRLGHNIFEPLAHGVPILFGPHMNLWRRFTEPIKHTWPECEIKDAESLASSAMRILRSRSLWERLRETSFWLSSQNSGIVDRHIDLVRDYLR